ncbi:MAG: CDP-alcohol phosphatidyltransferase family protein [archaeon]
MARKNNGKEMKSKANELSLKELQAVCFKESDCIIMGNYRKLSTRITMRLYKKGILPWQITLAAFAVALVGAGLFLFGQYPYLVAGVLLLQVSFILDCVDGEIARINKTGSPFGAWLDPTVDFYSTAAFMGAAAIGQYFLLNDAAFLIAGIPAVISFAMVSYMVSTRARYVEKSDLKPTVGISSKRRIGNRGLSMALITVGALTNQIFPLLLIFTVVWTGVWIKMVFDFYALTKKLAEKNKA